MTITRHSSVGRREIALCLNFPASLGIAQVRKRYEKMKTLILAAVAKLCGS